MTSKALIIAILLVACGIGYKGLLPRTEHSAVPNTRFNADAPGCTIGGKPAREVVHGGVSGGSSFSSECFRVKE